MKNEIEKTIMKKYKSIDFSQKNIYLLWENPATRNIIIEMQKDLVALCLVRYVRKYAEKYGFADRLETL